MLQKTLTGVTCARGTAGSVLTPYSSLNLCPKTSTFRFSKCCSDWCLRSARVSRGGGEINESVPQSTMAALNLTRQTGCFTFSNATAGRDNAGLSPATANQIAFSLVGYRASASRWWLRLNPASSNRFFHLIWLRLIKLQPSDEGSILRSL